MATSNARAEFEIALKDETAAGVTSSVSNLHKMEGSLKGVTKEYNETKAAMANLRKGTVIDVEMYRKLDDKQKALGSRLGNLQTHISKQKTALTEDDRALYEATKGTKKFEEALKSSGDCTKKASGNVGILSTKIGDLKVGTLAAWGVMVGAAVAAYELAKGFASLAISSADAYRSELLHFEAITKIRNVWGITTGSAQVMRDAVDRVSDSVALSREQLGGYAEQLQTTGFRGANLSMTLEGMAILAQTQGEKYAQAFAGMASQTVYFGGTVKTMLDDVKARLGKNLAAQMLSLPNVLASLKKNVASLFRDLNIEPFLKALKRMSDLLSLNTATGQALKQMFAAVFNALFGQAGKAADTVQEWVERTIIKMQELTISVLTALKSGGKTVPQAIGEWLQNVVTSVTDYWGPRVLDALKAVFGFLGAHAGELVGPFLLGLVGALADGASYIMAGFDSFPGTFVAWFQEQSNLAWDAGLNLVKGIASGITSGIPKVLEAIGNLAKSALNKFKGLFGISSPAKVMIREAGWIPAGVAVGIRSGLPNVRAAMNDMYQATSFGSGGCAEAYGAGVSGGGRPSLSVVIQSLVIQAASGSAPDIQAAVQRGVEDALEHYALEMGATG